jgi:hypothetical protein
MTASLAKMGRRGWKLSDVFGWRERRAQDGRPRFVEFRGARSARLLTGTHHEHIMNTFRTREGCMARVMVSALRDLWELASLGAFLLMIAMVARAFGA